MPETNRAGQQRLISMTSIVATAHAPHRVPIPTMARRSSALGDFRCMQGVTHSGVTRAVSSHRRFVFPVGDPAALQTADIIAATRNDGKLVKLVTGVNNQGATVVKLGR